MNYKLLDSRLIGVAVIITLSIGDYSNTSLDLKQPSFVDSCVFL